MKLIIDIPDNELKAPLRNIHLLISNEIVTEVIIKKYDKDKPYYMNLNYALLEESEDCISRQAVIEVLNKMDRYVADELTLCDTERKFPQNEVFIVDDVYEEIVEQLPPVNPAEKVGHWTRVSMDKYVQHAMAYYRCSECGKDIIGTHNYCPNCGAKMQEVGE